MNLTLAMSRINNHGWNVTENERDKAATTSSKNQTKKSNKSSSDKATQRQVPKQKDQQQKIDYFSNEGIKARRSVARGVAEMSNTGEAMRDASRIGAPTSAASTCRSNKPWCKTWRRNEHCQKSAQWRVPPQKSKQQRPLWNNWRSNELRRENWRIYDRLGRTSPATRKDEQQSNGRDETVINVTSGDAMSVDATRSDATRGGARSVKAMSSTAMGSDETISASADSAAIGYAATSSNVKSTKATSGSAICIKRQAAKRQDGWE